MGNEHRLCSPQLRRFLSLVRNDLVELLVLVLEQLQELPLLLLHGLIGLFNSIELLLRFFQLHGIVFCSDNGRIGCQLLQSSILLLFKRFWLLL